MSDPLDELLDDVLGEIRDDVTGESERAAESRTRVLASRRRQKRRYDTLLAAAAALLVFFVAPTVWAHVTGRLPAMMESLGLVEAEPAAADASPRRSGAGASGSEAAVAPVEAEPPVLDEVQEPVDEAPFEEPPVEAVAEAAAGPIAEPAAEPVTETVVEAPLVERRQSTEEVDGDEGSESTRDPAAERELFTAAHEAHFAGGSPTSALGAWNTYLERYPQGAFVPEARYNRAVTLVRLGRYDAAKAALGPFAQGVFGETRRSEAERLLEAIEERVGE